MSKDNKMEVFVDYFKHELAEVLHHNISLYMDQMLLDLVRLIGEACFSQDRHVAVVMLDFVMAHWVVSTTVLFQQDTIKDGIKSEEQKHDLL